MLLNLRPLGFSSVQEMLRSAAWLLSPGFSREGAWNKGFVSQEFAWEVIPRSEKRNQKPATCPWASGFTSLNSQDPLPPGICASVQRHPFEGKASEGQKEELTWAWA